MQVIDLDFDQVPQLSKIDKAYNRKDENLRPFYTHEVALENFEAVIQNKQGFSSEKRSILVEELERQYALLGASPQTAANIQLLKKENCFTIITAHQPNLFTGPLYSIHKIVSTINLCQTLSEEYPAYHFVPVFWSGGEDHDFEEVNHCHLFGKKITWSDEQGGSVGKYTTDSLKDVLAESLEILGQNENAQKIGARLREFYTNASSYSVAHRQFVNWIFGKYGLVLCDANNAAFKAQMIPVFEEELLEQSSKPILEKTAQALADAGFSHQAHSRDINLFYLSPNRRDRITLSEDGQYEVLNTELRFSREEILAELYQNPQNFSPNVIMRPLFQETIFPNLAYIGGGGELAYWLERKEQFAHFNLSFPMLIRRCSALWIDANSYKKIEKLNLSIPQIFEETDNLLKNYVLDNSQNELSLSAEQEQLAKVFDQILQKSNAIDPALEKAVLGMLAQTTKSIDKFEKKLIRAEKNNNEVSVNQIRKIKEKLFPQNGLQERKDTFLTYYVQYGDTFLESLMKHLHPLKQQFTVIIP